MKKYKKLKFTTTNYDHNSLLSPIIALLEKENLMLRNHLGSTDDFLGMVVASNEFMEDALPRIPKDILDALLSWIFIIGDTTDFLSNPTSTILHKYMHLNNTKNISNMIGIFFHVLVNDRYECYTVTDELMLLFRTLHHRHARVNATCTPMVVWVDSETMDLIVPLPNNVNPKYFSKWNTVKPIIPNPQMLQFRLTI